MESSKQIHTLSCCSVTGDSRFKLNTWWHQRYQHSTRLSTKMRIVDSVKKNSERRTWPVMRTKKQPEPWCLACTWNMVILILEELSTLLEENMQIDSSLLQPRSSAAALVKKVRDGGLVRLLLDRVLHEPGTCLQVDQFEWKQPTLTLHVLGTIMVDAGSRAASVTIHRVMDTEHRLGNVTRGVMLNTLLNHWITYNGKPNIFGTEPERSISRSGISTWSCCQEHSS